jgi:hypothetical protein
MFRRASFDQGLPDFRYFHTKNPNLEGLAMEQAGLLYGHLIYFMDIGYLLLSFGTFCAHLVPFLRFWYHVPRKIWQPWTVVANVHFFRNEIAQGSHHTCGAKSSLKAFVL